MRFALPTLALFALAACETALPPVDTRAGMTPFTWKANTPLDTRAADINECELAARGLPPNADAEMIAASSNRSELAQERAFVRSCLENKGYTITTLPICTTSEKARGRTVTQPEFLPPLESIRCADPATRSPSHPCWPHFCCPAAAGRSLFRPRATTR